MIMNSLKSAAFAISLAVCLSTPASAGSLVYTPVNPSFGGNPLNGSWLLSQAQAQNQYTPKTPAPSASANTTALSPGQQFAATLTSQLYASLANNITQAIFGPNAQTSGTYQFEGTTINFNRVGNNINITVFDGTTTTTITVPAS